MNEEKYELGQFIIKPLYWGLMINILIPMAGILVCYYLHINSMRENLIGDFANPLFYIFAVLAVAQAALSLWWRTVRLRRLMVTSEETFEEDLIAGFLKVSKPVFVLIAFISGYGFLYYFLTGRFTETVVFVFFSFIVFQIIRPRYGLARKLVQRQKELLKEGKKG